VGGLVRATAVVLVSSATVMTVGLLKNVLAAFYFGTSGDMDSYLLALLLPDVAMHLARTGAFNFIPLFAAERRRSEADAWRAAARMLTYWLMLLVVALIIGLAVSSPAVSLLAPGFSPPLQAQTVGFTRILFLMAATVGAARIFAVTLHAERRFLAAGASEAAFQLVSVLYLVVFHDWGIESLVWAQVIGGFAQLLVAALGLWRQRRRLRPEFAFRTRPVRRMVRLSLPVYLGDSGDKINLMVTRAFASLLPAGAVSALQYALTVVEGLHSLLVGSFITALFPYLSQRFAQGGERGAFVGLHRAAVLTSLVFLPLAAGTWLAAEPLVVTLFERGSFDVTSTELTASALRLYAPALLALGLNALLGSMFHARQDTLTPMWAGLVRVGVNIALCATLAPTFGHEGIALATTVALFAKLAHLLRALRRILPDRTLGVTLRAMARPLPAVLLMSLVVYPAASLARVPRVLEDYALPLLLALGLLGLSAYSAGLWLFCRRELVFYVALVHRALIRSRRPRHPAAEPDPAKELEGVVR
jgi:putative peptidoglycan lipid II flippase